MFTTFTRMSRAVTRDAWRITIPPSRSQYIWVHPSTASTTPFLKFWDRSIPASSAYFEIETYVIALNCFRSGRLLRVRVPGCPVPWTVLWLDRRRHLNLPKSAFIFCYLTALIQGNLGTHSIPIFSHNRFTWRSTRSATTCSRAAEISGWSSNLISCLCVYSARGVGCGGLNLEKISPVDPYDLSTPASLTDSSFPGHMYTGPEAAMGWDVILYELLHIFYPFQDHCRHRSQTGLLFLECKISKTTDMRWKRV